MTRIRVLIEYLVIIMVIITLNFFLARYMPGEPLGFLYEDSNFPVNIEEDTLQELMNYYGLDRPLSAQFVSYLGQLARGDFGYSIYHNIPVIELVKTRLPWTLLLLGFGLILSLLLGIILGANSAWRRNTALDKGMLVGLVTASRIPSFIVAIFLLILFSAKLGWFPLGGAVTPFKKFDNAFLKGLDILWHLALPLVTLVLTQFSSSYLLTRNSMITTIRKDFIFTARAKGIGEQRIKYQHALRNSLLPVVTMLFMKLGRLAAGSVFVETVFAYPGIGLLMFESLEVHDYPVLGACFLILIGTVLLANFAADQVYRFIDPRVQRA